MTERYGSLVCGVFRGPLTTGSGLLVWVYLVFGGTSTLCTTLPPLFIGIGTRAIK